MSSGCWSIGTSRSSSVSALLRITCARWRRRASPTLPFTSSTRSTSASSEPYSTIHLAAVFSPTDGILGRLSLGSPRSAAKSGYCAGVSPYLSCTASGVIRREVADSLARIQDGHPVADELEGVAVAGADQHVEALRLGALDQGGDHVVRLVAGRSDDRDAQGVQHLADQRDLRAELVGRLRPVRLVLGERRRPEGRPGPRRTPPRRASAPRRGSTLMSIEVKPYTAFVGCPVVVEKFSTGRA